MMRRMTNVAIAAMNPRRRKSACADENKPVFTRMAATAGATAKVGIISSNMTIHLEVAS
jgi:hypothetical protein